MMKLLFYRNLRMTLLLFVIIFILQRHVLSYLPSHNICNRRYSLVLNGDNHYDGLSISKLSKACILGLYFMNLPMELFPASASSLPSMILSVDEDEKLPMKGYQTSSGLIYFDIPGTMKSNISPKYGQLISLQYTTYYRDSISSPLQVIDSTLKKNNFKAKNIPFLQKHGNGRLIRGLEEGLHTMKLGSKRRLIIPASLGFIDSGLGPLPVQPFARRKLGNIIDLVNSNKGQLVMDIELVSIIDDENDQGYYEDEAISQEEVRELVRKSIEAKKSGSIIPLKE